MKSFKFIIIGLLLSMQLSVNAASPNRGEAMNACRGQLTHTPHANGFYGDGGKHCDSRYSIRRETADWCGDVNHANGGEIYIKYKPTGEEIQVLSSAIREPSCHYSSDDRNAGSFSSNDGDGNTGGNGTGGNGTGGNTYTPPVESTINPYNVDPGANPNAGSTNIF